MKTWPRINAVVTALLAVVFFAGAALAFDITGAITNNTGKTGRMYFSAVDQYGDPVAGMSAPSGTLTVTMRGVPSGTFTINGFIDTQGTGSQHANDPAFSSGPMEINGDGGAPVTFTNPPAVAAVAPRKPMAMPLDGAAFLFIDAPTTNNGIPIADKYDVYWSTDPAPGPGNTTGGGQLQVINGKAPQLVYGLTNGTTYYFAVNAVVSGGSSALSPVSDPVTPTNTPAAGGSTVNVTVDSTGVVKNNTPLIVALSDNKDKVFLNYVKVAGNVQTVAIPGVTAGTYKIYAVLDLDGNGSFEALANPSNASAVDRNQRTVPIMVDGVTSVVTGPTVKLAVKNAGVSVSTIHSNYGGGEGHKLLFRIVQMNKQLVNVTLVSGPQVAGPIDLGTGTRDDQSGAFHLFLPVNSRPVVGDTYSFTLHYVDGAQEPRTAAVTAVLDVFPGGVFPSGSIGPDGVSLLAWNNPGNLSGFLTTSVGLNNLNMDFLPLSVLSTPYQGSPFAAGQWFSWNRTVEDPDGNRTEQSISFGPNASGPHLTDFNPKSGADGTTVTITGTGFDGTPANNAVAFNGMGATVTAASPTSLTVTAPASSGVITVKVNGVTAGSSAAFGATTTFTATLADGAYATLTPLAGATFSLVENPAILVTTAADGTAILPVPARPQFSLAFRLANYYPTYSAVMNLTAPTPTPTTFYLYNAANLASRGTPLSSDKGLIASRVQDRTTGSTNVVGAVVTAKSLLHPDTPYTVKYTDGTTNVAQDPTVFTQTSADGRYYVLDVDEGDYVTVTATKAGMGFQSLLFNTHGGAVSAGNIKGAIVLVSPPTASPAGGTYTNTQNVALNNPDSTNYDVFYTTDGSDPALFGMKYSGGTIAISTTTTLKFVTKNKNVGQAVGGVQTQVYTFQSPPVINGFNPGGGVPGTQVTIDGSGFDGATPANNIVHFPGTTTPATVISASQNQLVVTVPGDATAPANGPITVTVGSLPESSSPTSFAVTTTISVSGTVKEPGVGNVSEATVQLYNNALVTPATSDVNGNFTLNGLPSNAPFTIKTSKSGYADSFQDLWFNLNSTGTVLIIFKSPLSSTFGNTDGTGVIRGRVSNSTNRNPLAGATVTISPANAGQVVYGGTASGSPPDTNLGSTQASGIFYIRNVSPNNMVNITVTLNGFNFPGPFGASVHADAVTQMEIFGNDLNPNIGSFNPMSGVAGTQVNISGSSFDGATPSNNIVLFPGSSTPATVVSATQGQLVVTVPADAQPASGPITVTVGARNGSSGSNNFTVTETISLSGTVKEAGAGIVADATVQLYNNTLLPPATSDGSGDFTLNGVPKDASFTIRTSKPTYADSYQDFWNSQNISGATLILYQAPLSATLENTAGKGVIRGRVVNQVTGNPVAGATVTASAGQVVYGGTGSASLPDQTKNSTQGSGVFYIRNVTLGNFVNITVSLTGFTFQSMMGANSYADAITQLEIFGTPPNFNLTTNITGNGSIGNVINSPFYNCFSGSCSASFAQGTSLILRANPAPNSTFTGWSGACSGPGDCAVTINGDTTVNAEFFTDTTPPVTTASPAGGSYLLPQNVTLSANEPATIYYTTDGSDPMTSPTNHIYGGSINIAATTTLKFYARDTAGNSESIHTLTYTITGSAISFSGSVKGPTGVGLSGITVQVVENPSLTATSAANGNFSIANIPSGQNFTVKASGAGFKDAYYGPMNSTTNIGGRSFTVFAVTEFGNWNISPGKGVISGQVRVPGVGYTLQGATVSIVAATGSYTVVYDDGSGSTPGVGSSTSANGRFYILNVNDGDTVTLSAAKTGWNFNQASITAHADSVNEASITAVTIKFTSGLTDSATPANNLVGATVEMVGYPEIATTTAADGSFTLAGLPSGNPFSLKLSMSGFAPVYSVNFNSATNVTSPSAYVAYSPGDLTGWGVNAGKGVIRTRVVDSADQATGYLGGAVVTAASSLHPAAPYAVTYYDGTNYGGTATYPNGVFMIVNVDDGDTVTVTASKPGWSTVSLDFLTHGGGVSEGRIPLTGAATPVIAATPPSLTFGNVGVGSASAPQTLTFTNNGTADLVVSASSYTGPDALMFSAMPAATNGCPQLPATFIAGHSCDLLVTFTPTATGGRSATLNITSNDPATPTLSVQLSGIGVDNTSPVLTSVHIGSDNNSSGRAKVGDTITVTFTASEPIDHPAVTIAGHPAAVAGSGSSWTATYTMTSGDSEGAISFSVNGYADLASNPGATVTATTDASSVTFDKTAPTLTISSLGDGAVTNNDTLNVAGNASDASGIKSLTVNGAAVSLDGNGHFSHAQTLVAGPNTITTVATDNAGNQNSDVRHVSLDQTAPTLTVSAPADNSKTSSTFVAVTGSVNENSTVTVNGTPAAMNGQNFSSSVNLASGINTITIIATDLATNTNTAIRTVTSDTGAPSLAVTNPPQDITTSQNSIIISGTVSDALTAVTVVVSVDRQNYSPPVTNGTFSQIIALTTEKTYAVTVTATDEAANHLSVQRNIIYSNPVSSGPAVDLGTAGGVKGYTVTVPVTLTNLAGTDLSGLSIDIGYDTNLLNNPTATIGAAGLAANKSISKSTPFTGVFRVGIVGVNTDIISDGVVANVTFNINPAAIPGNTTLTNTPGATDPAGQEVTITGKSGTVKVISKAGDCDGIGGVIIAEVQSAINMFLGLKAVASCVDTDSAGGVTIAEVQKTINSFLGL
jgi:Chitobiase/beta-hexosaminidase C-terminal domain/Glucodextranase, domain B/IPT/TIG domain/Divergent InlB B-repeat domain